MALIKCPECKKDISDKALVCPKCGYELKSEGTLNQVKNSVDSIKSGTFKFDYKFILIIAVLIIGAYFIFNQNKQSNSGGTSTPSSNSGYSVFNSSYMGISFEYPTGYKVATDKDGFIYVAKNIDNEGALIPYIMIGRYDNYYDSVAFLTDFTSYMRQQYSDLIITIDLVSGVRAGRTVYGLAYNYTSGGHLVVDNRYAVTINNKVYMIGSKEENVNSAEINDVVGHILDTITEGGK